MTYRIMLLVELTKLNEVKKEEVSHAKETDTPTVHGR